MILMKSSKKGITGIGNRLYTKNGHYSKVVLLSRFDYTLHHWIGFTTARAQPLVLETKSMKKLAKTKTKKVQCLVPGSD